MENDKGLKKAMNQWAQIIQDPQVLMTYDNITRDSLVDENLISKEAEKQGEKNGVRRIALRMIKKGMDNETICELTELTEEELEHLRRQ
ncbi:hypothetical protein [Priestia megaterium]|uniref:hypothetical protein n=1 Tax=Priestia megaterium TaxID=1404 RepID=UPI0023648912|nr:hypothetical protein [Priestia megaterium]MDD1515302.1 hypothetical protein [Priestia megaterium]